MIDAKLNRLIYYNNNIEVKSFTVLPKLMRTDHRQSDSNINLSIIMNCCLIISYAGNNGSNDYKSKMYSMTLKNRRATQRFFSKVLSWLEDASYADMFYYNTDNSIEFNLDYRDLIARLPQSKNNNYSLEARPVVYEDNMGRREGISLTFNQYENTVSISWEDFSVLADIVLNFDFEAEALLLMQSFMIGCQLDRLTTPDEERINRRIERGSKDPFR